MKTVTLRCWSLVDANGNVLIRTYKENGLFQPCVYAHEVWAKNDQERQMRIYGIAYTIVECLSTIEAVEQPVVAPVVQDNLPRGGWF